jgi:hypothetical protein
MTTTEQALVVASKEAKDEQHDDDDAELEYDEPVAELAVTPVSPVHPNEYYTHLFGKK